MLLTLSEPPPAAATALCNCTLSDPLGGEGALLTNGLEATVLLPGEDVERGDPAT